MTDRMMTGMKNRPHNPSESQNPFYGRATYTVAKDSDLRSS